MNAIKQASHVTVDQAQGLLLDAWNGGKNKDHGTELPRHFRMALDDPNGYVLALVPLDWVRPNDEGDRYDGTVDMDRARRYAQRQIDTPVHLLFGQHAQKRGVTYASVSDGGHRITAARMRGDTHLWALMPAAHIAALERVRESVAAAGEEGQEDSSAGLAPSF